MYIDDGKGIIQCPNCSSQHSVSGITIHYVYTGCSHECCLDNNQIKT